MGPLAVNGLTPSYTKLQLDLLFSGLGMYHIYN